MGVYSFLNVQCTFSGPGGTVSLGQGEAGIADEGITVSATEDKNTMAIGADGTPMHSLHAGNPGLVSIRLQKTSPLNHALMEIYNYQRQSAVYWGQNTILVDNFVLGDSVKCVDVAFRKIPDFTNPKIAGMVEWQFDAGQISETLVAGPAVTPF